MTCLNPTVLNNCGERMMKKRIFLLLVVVFLNASTGFTQWISLDKNSIPDSKPEVHLLKDNGTESGIKVDLPGFRINDFNDQGKAYQSIDIGELAGKISEAGMPDIPYVAKILAVPNEGTISVEVLEVAKTQIIKGINIPPARQSWSEGK